MAQKWEIDASYIASEIPKGNTVDMLKAAFAADGFMGTTGDEKMRASLGAVLIKLGKDHEDYAKLTDDIQHLKKVNAYLGAIMAGLSVYDPPEEYDPHFPIMDLWAEANK